MRWEDEMQKQVFRWARDAAVIWPALNLLYHPENEGKRSPAQGARAKALGLNAGVPDIHLPVARHGFHGLWIELKTPGGRLTTRQATWIEALDREGHLACVCYCADEAIAQIEYYVKGETK